MQTKARIAGAFYLGTFITGFAAIFTGGRLIVSGDAAATATNILAHEALFRAGWVSNLIATACYIAVTALFYELFRPVSRSVSLLAAFFSLVGCALGAFVCSVDAAVSAILKGSPIGQVQAIASMFLKLASQCGNVGLVFFGFYCLLIGYLIFNSTFLPRILGVLMMMGGLGWLTFVWPPLSNFLNPYILLPGIIGEGSLTLWLLVIGVKSDERLTRAT